MTCRIRKREITTSLTKQTLTGRDRRRNLAVHLSTGCPHCWSRVDAVSKPVRPSASADPMTRALRRIHNRASWPHVPARHLRALRDVREVPWGFVNLMIEEARNLVAKRGFASGGFMKFFIETAVLIEALERQEPHAALSNVKARLALACVLFHAVREGTNSEQIDSALATAEQFVAESTRCPDLELDLERHVALLDERIPPVPS